MSPGLLRAREQYRVKNAITGVLVAAFVVGVYWYSILAVKQDTFDDIDEEARAMFAEGRREGVKATQSAPEPAPAPAPAPFDAASRTPPQRRGVLSPILDRAMPGLLDPKRKTLVWGAPPVDAIGKLSDKRS
ncbi:hypothetical protein K488DRAFT_48827 [Vararia minispora EC-137]|uniref:Uncharacterized protein n=1 Tax=Vararia minispora EC-137 TaxID=1314806 RepID=A0ACB8QNC0_9AGAM|nr:hypothetical protein K488DRAFT_48827 [Vararia minispora EC-137]